MRSLYFSLVGALTLVTAAIGCDHMQKWHETGESQPMYVGDAANAQPFVVVSPAPMEPPLMK